MSVFSNIRSHFRGQSSASDRLTCEIGTRHHLPTAVPPAKAGNFRRRMESFALVPPAPSEGDKAVESVRISRVEVTVGQMWILRVKLTYRMVVVVGRRSETREVEVACPEEEVKSTRYINGKESSQVCHVDLGPSEFLTGCTGLVHLHEHLFTDLSFQTNKTRHDFRSARSSDTGVRQRSWEGGERAPVCVWKAQPRRGRRTKGDGGGGKGDVGIIGLRLGMAQTWTNMTGFCEIGAVVNRFEPVADGTPEEWTDERLAEVKRQRERIKADREGEREGNPSFILRQYIRRALSSSLTLSPPQQS